MKEEVSFAARPINRFFSFLACVLALRQMAVAFVAEWLLKSPGVCLLIASWDLSLFLAHVVDSLSRLGKFGIF